MSKLERQEEIKVLEWCKENEILCIKYTPMGSKGWPDRIFIFKGGLHVWVEFKRKGKKPNKIQLYRMSQLEKMGVLVGWFDSAYDAIEYLDLIQDEVLASASVPD